MILGVGTDIVDARRIAKSIDRFSNKFTARIFTKAERVAAAATSRGGDGPSRWRWGRRAPHCGRTVGGTATSPPAPAPAAPTARSAAAAAPRRPRARAAVVRQGGGLVFRV